MKAGQSSCDHDLILVTGGAGFIGSNIVLELAKAGARVAVCDLLRSGEKWRNLSAARLHDVIHPDALFEWLARNRDKVAAVVHMGAISSTTETDVDRFVATNIRLTLDLWRWCAHHSVRFIYASSAATYGDGSGGFSDEQHPDALAAFRPLYPYGWSKHLVDQRVISDVAAANRLPRNGPGLSFFNVYGPNESTRRHAIAGHQDLPRQSRRAGDVVKISRQSRIPRWRQLRDFVYVKDCVARFRPVAAGRRDKRIVQCRNRHARSFLDLVNAVCAVVGCAPNIRFVDTPTELRAISILHSRRRHKLRHAGFDARSIRSRTASGLSWAAPRKLTLERRAKWRKFPD
jgi:ADP-L-glycero-D-manno-heptose 6-epimerase